MIKTLDPAYAVLYWFSFVAIIAGLLGFSSKPNFELEKGDDYLKAIVTFYLISDFGFFIHGVVHYFWGTVVYVEIALVLLLLAASVYLMNFTKLERFEAAKFRDGLIYGCVAVLMGKNLPIRAFPSEVSLIMAFIAIAVFWLTLLLYRLVRRMAAYFDFESHESVISCTFFVVYITGLSCLLVRYPKIHFALDAISSAILLYILYKIYEVAKPFIPERWLRRLGLKRDEWGGWEEWKGGALR